jgi:hypothetical protein
LGAYKVKTKIICLLIVLFLPILSFAEERLGVLYGSIKLEEGVPNPGKVYITLKCGEEKGLSLFSAIDVDIPGTFECPYKISPEREKCSLIFFLGDKELSQDIYIFKKPRRYDFIIDKVDDAFVIKRR